MKVAVLAYELYPMNLGGLGTHLRHISDALSKRCKLEVFIPFDMNVPGLRTIEVPVKGAKGWVTRGYRMDLVKTYNEKLPDSFGKHKADVVHAHDWVTADAGRRIKERFGVPLVITVHSSMLAKKKNAGTFVKEKYDLESAFYSADRIIAVSNHVKEELIELYKLDPDIIRVVYNGIHAERFCEGPDMKFILFIGRLDPMKGVEYLIEAYSTIRSYFPHKLVISGKGGKEYTNAIRKRAEELGLEGDMIIRGRVTEEELVRLYAECTIVCLPSVYEPFGITVLEGMAAGKPVITTDKSGASEIVKNWKDAVVVKSRDSEDLADAMRKLLGNDRLRERISKGALRLARRYSWDRIAKDTIKVYKELT